MVCELYHHKGVFKMSLKTQGRALKEEGQKRVSCH